MRLRPAYLLFLHIIVMASVTFGAEPTGSIKGEVVSQRTRDPVVGAFVMVDGTSYGSITDASGNFTITDIPVGGYNISVTSVGYHSRVKTDVMVRSKRTTFIDFSLEIAVISGGIIEVRPEYFAEDDTQPTSLTEFAGEQIRRTPGSAGDVTRVIAGLPSIAKVDDQYNGLAVRGGNPLENGFYGLLAGSYSVSEYRSPGEEWRNWIFDNRWICTLEGGYRLDRNWEFSCRWMFAGGRPYTPLDLAACEEFNRTILDETRINAERYPAYHSLNIRVDRRFYFSGSSLICYASVWNVYNRRNVTATYWNQIDRKEDYIHQWRMMPILGLEFEF